LTDLRSFRIDWTRAESSAQGSVTVNNPSISTYVIENLQPGTYTFTISAINANGVASEPSNSVTHTIS
jgi:predicted phage tail protein